MKDILKYENFIGSVHFASEDEVFYGKIEGIDDLVTFEGSSVNELKRAFQEAVEDYKYLCKKANKDPHKSFKGSFNIRIHPELHKLAHQLASIERISLNHLIQQAITHEVERKKEELKLVLN